MSVTVLNPVGDTTIVPFDVAARISDLRGKRVGLIDNMKPNAGLFVDKLAELIKTKFENVELIKVRKNLTTNSAIAHELEGRVDVAINAWGD
jgi:hypothetical protein